MFWPTTVGNGSIKGIMPRHTLIVVNATTFIRFGLAALIIVAAVLGKWDIILPSAIIAFASDWVDGKLARRWQVVSGFGKFIDPLADKAVCLAILWPVAVHYDQLPYWLCAIIITLYDVYTTSMRLLVRKSSGTMVGASMVAKSKTALLMVGLCLVILGIIDTNSFVRFSGITLVSGAALLSLFSLWQYRKVFSDTKKRSA